MVGVPSETPAVCVDAYEVVMRDGVTFSEAGSVPTVGLTFSEARAACAATPALDADGTAYASKSLVTSDDWEDAGDGLVGDGGTAYPYGDAWQEGACATPTADGEVTIAALQPAGTFPSCRSAFGAYDQVGNAWEWTDPGMEIDVAAALAARAAEGQVLRADDAGVLSLDAGDPARLLVGVVGVDRGAVELDADGRLAVAGARIQGDATMWVGTGGFLFPTSNAGHASTASDFLPIRIYPADEGALDGPWLVHLDADADAAPISDKRGCAFYNGNEQACLLDPPFYEHTADFWGTIGFRCAAPPHADEG